MKKERPKSRALFDQALRVEPGGVGGSDKRGPLGGWVPHPIFMTTGEGAYLFDVDGNRYIDYLAAWGPLVLGHRPPSVLKAVHEALDRMGPTLGFNHELEIAAAEAVVDAVPCWEQVRFMNTGTEAIMLGLRAARAYTGRIKVLRFEGHFHGWSDLIAFSSNPGLERSGSESDPVPVASTGGIVESLAGTLVICKWNDVEALEHAFSEHGAELAAVICEPLAASMSVIPPKPGYLKRLRELATQYGAVLIFDEVKSGFRIALGGAQEIYGVLPDLSTAAKAMGAGFAVAALGGRRELFEPFVRGKTAEGSTYQANPIALAAVVATLKELRAPGFYERITKLGDRLAEGLTAAAHEAGIPAYTTNVGPVLQPVFADRVAGNYREFISASDAKAYAAFWRGMVDGGVMFGPDHAGCWFVSGAHTEADIEDTVQVAGEVLIGMAS
jgi:glutamate-1-semialdehyde 2,1-aminomutase